MNEPQFLKTCVNIQKSLEFLNLVIWKNTNYIIGDGHLIKINIFNSEILLVVILKEFIHQHSFKYL